MQKKVIVFIDGFNLYHAINAHRNYHKYKWLNLNKLANLYITKNEKIVEILYFTALATWNQSKVKKHKLFIKANELIGIRTIYGEFKKRDKYCNLCHKKYQTFEEKQTDVNIAIQLFKLSIENKYDKAIIISGDSDLLPSIGAVRKTFPTKQIGVIIPIGRRAEALKQACDFYMKMKEKHLSTSRFEQRININQNEYLECPPEWR
jgi:uncharacterized LabA/DUF88 family protein